jgi:hypothetical protein
VNSHGDVEGHVFHRCCFALAPEEYQAVSVVIAESIKLDRIAPADPDQGKRNARYVPYSAA